MPDGRLVAGLAPLLAFLEDEGALHLSLVGSAAAGSLDVVGDVDLHVVMERLDRPLWQRLRGAGAAASEALGHVAGGSWRLELRRGPFKPDPASGAQWRQLHLLVDDVGSLRKLPEALVLHGIAVGRRVSGEPLDHLCRVGGAESLFRRRVEARCELGRQVRGLRGGAMPYRAWRFEPRPRLVEGMEPIASSWMRRNALRALGTSVDLFTSVAGIEEPSLGRRLAPLLADPAGLATLGPDLERELVDELVRRRRRIEDRLIL